MLRSRRDGAELVRAPATPLDAPANVAVLEASAAGSSTPHVRAAAQDDVLDRGRRTELRGLDGTGAALGELTDRFFATSAHRLAELERLAGGEDREALRVLAHELRGSAANLGLADLAARCAELEAAVLAGAVSDGAACLRLAERVRAAADVARSAVASTRA